MNFFTQMCFILCRMPNIETKSEQQLCLDVFNIWTFSTRASFCSLLGFAKMRVKGILSQVRWHIVLCKALKTHDGAVCAASGEVSLSSHQPGRAGKLSTVAAVAKQCNKKCYRVNLAISGCLWLIFPATAFLSQVLGAKYKHEILVDHPFSNSAGRCGNFPFLPLILFLPSAFF